MKIYGWTGKILRVSLTNGDVLSVDTMPYAKDYLGGKGITTKILFDEVPVQTKPLDPENRLIFGTGPLTGTLAPASGRCNVTTKSPLTGIFGDANLGAYWSPELKFAGYDGIVIEGKASAPVYISIDNGHVQIRDARHLWGKDTWDTQRIVKEEIGNPAVQTLCIGPAGENLVKFACIVTGTSDTAARNGAGAVMGAKNLKAIAVRGTRGVEIANPHAFDEICSEAHESIRKSPLWEAMGKGAADAISAYIASGTVSYGYHDTSVPPGFDIESYPKELEQFRKKYRVRNVGCFSCPLRCQETYHVPEIGSAKLGCELWQQIPTFSKVPDFNFNFQCYILLQKYGMDVFSTASAIAFFIHLYQKGIISKKDTNGLALEFGDKDLFLSLIEQTAKREGIGNMIAQGTYNAAKKIGKGAEKHALTVKKLELPNFSFYEPGNALGAAGSERGGWFRSYGFAITIAEAFPEQGRLLLEELLGTEQLPDVDYEWMPQVLTYFEQAAGAADLVGICSWVTPRSLGPITLDTMSDLVSAATGLNMDANSLRVYLQRQQDTCRAFNMHEGITRNDDRPPEQYFQVPKQSPPHDGTVLDREKFENMLSEYYRLKGWDPRMGIPRRRERALHSLSGRSMVPQGSRVPRKK